MKRKAKTPSPNFNDIELPLLSEKNTKSLSFTVPNPTKSKFMDCFDSSSPPSKYITKMSFWRFITLSDMWALVKLSNSQSKPLNINDLPYPFAFCNIEQKIIAIDAEWNKSLAEGKPSIIKAILKAYRREILITLLLGFLLINFKFASSLLMGRIIKNISNTNFGIPMDYQETLMLTALLAFTAIGGMFSVNWCWHYAALVSANIRNSIIGYAYRKLQSVALSSLQQINIGKVINLLSNDVNELDKEFVFLMPLIWSPYTIMIGAIFIWKFFNFATIFGILGLVGALVFSNYLSKISISIKGQKKDITDDRIKLTNELIECIRLIKMYAWELPFRQAIQALRENEVIKLMKLRIIESLGRGISETSSQTSLVIICFIHIANGGVLSPQAIYTSLMILHFVGYWGISFPHAGIMFMATFKVIKSRLENLLFIEDLADFEASIKSIQQPISVNAGVAVQNPILSGLYPESTVIFENFSAWWKKDDPKPCLSNINVVLKPGELTTVIGTIGSGKTSFLLSMLREIPSTKGRLSFQGTVAYVEQEPIIFSGTVRSNILFGREYDDALYKKVMRACNLHIDLKQFESDDFTVVGERGVTLSGGQKARLSLARALYSQSDIYLLDDPLSAVDSKVGRHLFRYAFKGELLKDKIVILATHHLDYAKQSDRVLLFSQGQIVGDGTFEKISMENSSLTQFKQIEDELEKKRESLKYSSLVRGASEATEKQPTDEKASTTEEEIGSEVTWSTYFNYVRQNGSLLSFLSVISMFVLCGCFGIIFARFMGYWGQAHTSFYFEKEKNGSLKDGEQFDNKPYFITAVTLMLCMMIGLALETFLMANFLTQANSNMHNKLLNKIIQGRMLFFDQTPIGTILNRFSTDFGVLDTSNCSLFTNVLEGAVYIGFRMLTIVFVNPLMLIPLLTVLVALTRIKRFFQKPIMEVRNIDLSSRSPLYSEISATINGLLAIRTFRQGSYFIKKFCVLLYNNYRATLYTNRTMRFFSFATTVAFESLTIMGAFACVALAYSTNLEAGIFGLTLFLFQEISTCGSYIVRTSLLVDTNMQSVDRILKFYEIDQEAPQYIPKADSLSNWPRSGQVTLHNVYMKYCPDSGYVLKGLTFNIPGGYKVGVIGRTGAGKSSIIQTLFRMSEIENIPGSFILIDGVDISKIGLNLLRNSISIIPQTPVIFAGTVRRNLDPFGKFTDEDLWQVLKEVKLKEYVMSLEKKLDTDMTMGRSVFSAGQKQLVCLARAILTKNKIIVLDEATANVDVETDAFIQNKIMEKFRDSTVITIAHRIITVANYDKVLVMDKGSVVEYDSPYMLMVETEGDKEITRLNGVFAQMVRNSGTGVANKIFRMAYNKYFKINDI